MWYLVTINRWPINWMPYSMQSVQIQFLQLSFIQENWIIFILLSTMSSMYSMLNATWDPIYWTSFQFFRLATWRFSRNPPESSSAQKLIQSTQNEVIKINIYLFFCRFKSRTCKRFLAFYSTERQFLPRMVNTTKRMHNVCIDKKK